MHHVVNVESIKNVGTNKYEVEITGFDAEINSDFKGTLLYDGGFIRGDLFNPKVSVLSTGCRMTIKTQINNLLNS